jgi:kynurenine formamidase
MAKAGVQGRGVLVDIEAHFGRSGALIGYDELMEVMRRDQVQVETGDFLCVRTGFATALLEMKKKPDRKVLFETTSALDGRDARLLQWITDSGIVAIAADNYAVERLPARAPAEPCRCASLPLHEHCLFKLGVYLGEMWFLGDLADWLRQQGRSGFFLSAPPLRLPGAVASPVTPIATV